MQTNTAAVKTLGGPSVRGISPVGQGKGLWRKGFAEETSLEFRMKY